MDPIARIAAARRFVVAGNLCTDLVIRGVSTLPAWGQEVAGDGQALAPAGQGANLARGLARLGAPVLAVGAVGDDAFGRALVDDLAAHGVDVAGIRILPGATPLTVGIVRPDGERAFVSDFGCAAAVDEEFLAGALPPLGPGDVLCLVGQFNLPSLPPDAVARVLASARDAGAVTVVDTGWDPTGWPPEMVAAVRAQFAAADCVLPNADETAAVTGEPDAGAGARSLAGLGPELVVVKRGPAGSLGWCLGTEAASAAFPAEVADAIGAGDCFDAGFLFALWRASGLADALAFGNAAAAVYISRMEDRFPRRADIGPILSADLPSTPRSPSGNPPETTEDANETAVFT